MGKQLPPYSPPAEPANLASRLAERSASFLARVAEHSGHQLPAAVQAILADRQLVTWLAAVVGLVFLFLLLLVVLLLSQC